MKRRKLLIIGCPRSGTLFAARYFIKHFKMKIGHERIDKDGVSAWMMAVEPKNLGYPWGYCKSDILFSHTLHQVRHPVKTISSLFSIHNRSWLFIEDHIDISGMSMLEKAMKFWLEWNNICESKADYTYRLEDIDNYANKISSIIGVRYQHGGIIDSNTNSRKHPNLTWQDLKKENEAIYNSIVEKSAAYGYGS